MKRIFLISLLLLALTGCEAVQDSFSVWMGSGDEALYRGVGLVETYRSDGTLAATADAFLLSSDGIAVTAFHALADANGKRLNAEYAVLQMNLGTASQEYPIRNVMNFSRDLDIAIVRIDAEGFPYFRFGDSARLTENQNYKVVGTPRDYPYLLNKVNEGFISKASSPFVRFSVPSGAMKNAGSPILDPNNRVLGMLLRQATDLTGIATDGTGNEIFMALPAFDIKTLVEENINLELAVSDLPKENGIQAQAPLYATLISAGPDQIEVQVEGGSDGAYMFGIAEQNDVRWVTNWVSADKTEDGKGTKTFLALEPSLHYYVFVYRQATDRYAMSGLANVLEVLTP